MNTIGLKKKQKKFFSKMSNQPRLFLNELQYQNRAGFQSMNTSLNNTEDLDTIFMNDSNGYNPPLLRGGGGGLKFALPASIYKPYIDSVPSGQVQQNPQQHQGNLLAQNDFFLRPNPHAFATIPGCQGGLPIPISTAIKRGQVYLYE
jgi:hypothetical protein